MSGSWTWEAALSGVVPRVLSPLDERGAALAGVILPATGPAVEAAAQRATIEEIVRRHS